MTKKCTGCGEIKPATTEYFYKAKSCKDGLEARCKACRIKKQAKHYAENKTHILARQAEYNAKPENKARKKAYMVEYNAKPEVKARRKTYNTEYYDENKTHILARQAEYNAKPENKARKKAYNDEYDARPESKARRRERENNQHNNDPDFRMRKNLRRNFHHFLTGATKSESVMDLIGCTLDELWEHLESKFEPGMTRENYGEWHVDHIIPLSHADPNCWMQTSIVWDYTNLQPLWAKDNISKGAKLDWSKNG